MSQLDFGALHYGDDKQITFSVLNNSPKPARFFAACGTPQQFAQDTDGIASRNGDTTAFIQVVEHYTCIEGHLCSLLLPYVSPKTCSGLHACVVPGLV